MKKMIFQTNDKEAYEKFNMLNIVNEIVVSNNKTVNTILRKLIDVETIKLSDDLLLIKKKTPMKIEVYLR